MASVKVTERDIYNSIIAGTADQDVLVEFAEKKLAQLDRRNATAAKRAAKKREEADILLSKVQAVLDENPQTREQILDAVTADGTVAKLGQITNRLSRLCRDETAGVVKGKEKYKGEDNKTHEVTVYYLA